METYFSRIPLDLLTLIVSSLTIDKIGDVCSVINKCDPTFWDTLYRIKFNKRPPENSEKWFGDRLKEYRHYLITREVFPAVYKMSEFGMINELRNILNDYHGVGDTMKSILNSVAKGGYRNIVDLLLELYGSYFDDSVYKHAFIYAALGKHEDLMNFFHSLITTKFSNEELITGAILAARNGDLDALKGFLMGVHTFTTLELQIILTDLINSGNEDAVHWFAETYSGGINILKKSDHVYNLSKAAYYGNVKMFDRLLNVSKYIFTPEDYAEIMKFAKQENMIQRLVSLGASKLEGS